MASPKYDEIVEEVKHTNAPKAARRAGEPELFLRPTKELYRMSDVLTLSQIRMPGTARSKDDAIREAGKILVEVGAVTPTTSTRCSTASGRSPPTWATTWPSHGTNELKESIKRSALSVIRYPEPIDWDGNEVLFALGIAGYQGGTWTS